jgi:hypothetical protein
MAEETPKRRPGGQPKPLAERKAHNFTFRGRPDLRGALAAKAEHNQRSLSEEIEHRLYRDLEREKIDQDIKKMHTAAFVMAVRQAGFQIVRDAGGNVTINISPEMLLAEADGLLRSGFVAAENVDKSPTEIMTERVAKAAAEQVAERVEALLREAGLIRRNEGAA